MVFNTISVGAAIAPTIVKTSVDHFLHRKTRRQKPTAHISYDEGLHLIRRVLEYSSAHTVEELQEFTAQWVPIPRWVKVESVAIPQDYTTKAAEALIKELGRKGVNHIGGASWWQWRKEGSKLEAEWIEMRSHYQERKRGTLQDNRVMLYVHGGAYYFGSVDVHRYQLQRHARKMKARVLARMLVILRDQGLPMPAGAVLISPWVDLTHSFPSVSGDNNKDYIPQHGFVHRPSAAWPPPNVDDLGPIIEGAIGKKAIEAMGRKSSQHQRQEAIQDAVRGFSIDQHPRDVDPVGNVNNPAGSEGVKERPGNTIPGVGHDLSIMILGSLITIKDQIQMYTTNQLISHPLVSPVLQPSLGGLPPLLILTGGGEMLRDEQIYLAHKAADPSRYPPGEAYLTTPEDHAAVAKWKPTHVHLQVWDDLCHVAPTLSFTRPAKHMYRSIAKFCATVLAAAQIANIEYEDDDLVSLISTDTESVSTSEGAKKDQEAGIPKIDPKESMERRRRAGDDLPALTKYMIRERVDRNGNVRELEPPSALPALQLSLNEIGVIKPGIVGKWLETKQKWDTKYAREKRRIQKQRVKEIAKGYQDFEEDDAPPPSALAGRRGLGATKEVKKQKGWGLGWWSKWGSSHDEKTIERTEEKRKSEGPATTVVKGAHKGTSAEPGSSTTFPCSPGNKQKQREQPGGANSIPSDTTSTDSAASFVERRAKHFAAMNKVHARDPGPYIRLPPSPDFTCHEPNKKITISCNEESYNTPSNTQDGPTNEPNPDFPPWPSNERRDVATFDQVAVETLDPINLGESCGGSVLTTVDSTGRPAHVGRLDENTSVNQRGKQPINYAIRLPNADLEPPSEEAETPAPDLEDPMLHLPVPVTEPVTMEDPEGQIVQARCLGSEVLEFVYTDQLPSEVRRAMGIESGSESGVEHTTILSGDSQPVTSGSSLLWL